MTMNKELIEQASQTRRILIAAGLELRQHTEALFSKGLTDAGLFNKLIEDLELLCERFSAEVGEVEASFTRLSDGVVLLNEQYAALSECARGNSLSVNHLSPRLKVFKGEIVDLDWSNKGIASLVGLAGISTLARVNLCRNSRLQTLEGLPAGSITEVDASWCKLGAMPLGIEGCSVLRRVDLSWNSDLSALAGLPEGCIQDVSARWCDLKGDLSELANCSSLKLLDITGNTNISTLTGLAGLPLEVIKANECDLAGDLSALASCTRVRELHISGNGRVRSLKGVPAGSIEVLAAFLRCE
jgi:hypothetical protein